MSKGRNFPPLGSTTLHATNYVYDGHNRLVSEETDGKTITYDIGGLRNSKTVSGVTTKQVWSMGELAMEINGSNNLVKAKYYHGITPIGMESNEEGFIR